MPTPGQLGKFNFTSLTDPENLYLSQLSDRVNHILGYGNAPFTPAKGIDVQGQPIKNVGSPIGANDAVSLAAAETRYSAPALKPQLDAGGSSTMVGYRQLGSKSQREPVSSWLNDLMSTPPNSNTIFPTITPSGAQYQVSIPASVFVFADGSQLYVQGRTDLLSKPSQYAISSLSVAAGVVTCDVAATGLVAGEVVTCAPGLNYSYSGTFQLTSSASGGTILQWQSGSAAGTDTSGYIQVQGVYYYYLRKRTRTLLIGGPFSADTLTNRLSVSADGNQIVAVVTITNAGAQISQTGGGGTPLTTNPAAGGIF